jgi:hypothetical protein
MNIFQGRNEKENKILAKKNLLDYIDVFCCVSWNLSAEELSSLKWGGMKRTIDKTRAEYCHVLLKRKRAR